MKFKTDLHIHTTASDGCWTPEQLIKELQNKQITTFSITDHDSVENIIQTKDLAEQAKLTFIPGVEISTTYQGRLYHLLGYGIDPKNPQLHQFLIKNRELMDKKDDDSIKILIKEGHCLDFNEYVNYHNDSTRGGWKALNFLIDKGICQDASDFFRRLFHQQHKVPFPIFPEPQEAISVIKKAGGIAVIAHPGGNFGGNLHQVNCEIGKTLKQFRELEIDGIECYHPDHNKEVVCTCREYCQKNDLLITGGSDCHGEFIPRRSLGMPEICLSQLSLGQLKHKYINS